jgi:hypothetical protein
MVETWVPESSKEYFEAELEEVEEFYGVEMRALLQCGGWKRGIAMPIPTCIANCTGTVGVW